MFASLRNKFSNYRMCSLRFDIEENIIIEAFALLRKPCRLPLMFMKVFTDNLTKFIWVKNYTKTYKNRKNDRNIRKIRINTRVNRTEKIHEKEGKKSAKIYSDRGLLYKWAPPTAGPHTFGGFRETHPPTPWQKIKQQVHSLDVMG
jgi:hypothetical protein